MEDLKLKLRNANFKKYGRTKQEWIKGLTSEEKDLVISDTYSYKPLFAVLCLYVQPFELGHHSSEFGNIRLVDGFVCFQFEPSEVFKVD